ncbi:hypothetical protein MKX03_001319 [Papaver bracteatum]|nr:hypothetical protein MKX03_001319 [Papaver bracteatum]
MNTEEGNCLGWAARDPTGVLSPYKFNRKVGPNNHRFKVGDHVGVGTYVSSCRNCEYCDDGFEIHCSEGSVYTFNGVDVDGTITKGGYSSYVVVPERQV